MAYKSAKSKFIVIVLVLVLLLSGLGTTFLASDTPYIASINGKKIPLAEYLAFYRQRVNYIEGMTGQKLPHDALIDIKRNLIAEMIEDATISLLADEMGLQIGIESTKSYIRKIDAFLDEEGNFSSKKFKDMLSFLGMSEIQHAEKVQDYIERMILMESILNSYETDYAIPYNEKTIKALYSDTYQKRTADILELTKESVGPIKPPSKDEMMDFYKKNKQMFQTKGMRSFSYAIVDASTFEKMVSIDNVELDEIIAKKASQWQADIQNILFSTKEEAEQAARDLDSRSKTFDEIAKERLGDSFLEKIVVKDISKDAGYPVALTDEIFKLQPNKISKVIQTSMGWHILRLVSFHKPSDAFMKTFREFSSKLMIEKKRAQALKEAVYRMNEGILSGESLESVTKHYDVDLKHISFVDDSGLDQSGKKVDIRPEILDMAFSQQIERLDNFVFNGSLNAYVCVLVHDSIDKKQKSFEDSKADLQTAVMQKSLEAALIKEAKIMILRHQSGENIERFYGIKLIRRQDIYKNDVAKRENLPQVAYPSKLVDQLFAMKNPGITEAFLWNEGIIVASLINVQSPQNIDSSKMNNLKRALANNNIHLLRQEFIDALQSEYKPYINQSLMEKDGQ